MNFTDMLRTAGAQNQSMLCVGLDPEPSRFPLAWRGDARRIYEFCAAIVDATADLVVAFKPQIAYFAAHRAEDQLERLMAHIRRVAPAVPVILDAKRGDIGSTAAQYAREAFVRRMRPRLAQGQGHQRLIRGFTLSALLNGLTWGAFAWLYFDARDPLTLLLVGAYLSGHVGGAVTPLSIHLPAFYAYTFPTILPIAVTLVLAESGMLRLLGIISLGLLLPNALVGQFLVTVTYLMATSLILTGGLQLFFTRFVSDRLFERRLDLILPNLVGILLLVTIVSGLLLGDRLPGPKALEWGLVNFVVPDDEVEAKGMELAARLAALAGTDNGGRGGYQRLYVDHVLQADDGCDFDFLVGCRGAVVPRHSH